MKAMSRPCPGRFRIALCCLAALAAALTAAPAAAAPGVSCHVDYGGERRVIRAAATQDPYRMAPVAIGSYFLFRVVVEHPSRPLAGVKVTTYADAEGGPVPLHIAHHPQPVRNRGRFGFTGEQFVYEPVRDGELVYWCAVDSR